MTLRSGARRRSLAFFGTLALALISVATAATDAEARHWKRVVIPGAKCGDGTDYAAYVSLKDSKRIAITLMGGGACWDKESCFGPAITAWTRAIPGVWERSGWVSDDAEESPVSHHSMVYLPYCTGDVHVGDHTARYGNRTVYHWGRRNFDATMEYLGITGLVDLKGADQLVLYGYSAGALGSFLHSLRMDSHLSARTDKVMVADAPGLHFGPRFWDKFTALQLKDIDAALGNVGHRITPGNGVIAGIVPNICRQLPGWRVAVLQGTHDLVMSRVYGNSSPRAQAERMFAPGGIWPLMTRDERQSNCAVWLADTRMHSFLIDETPSRIEAGKKPAMSFARDAVEGRSGASSYRD